MPPPHWLIHCFQYLPAKVAIHVSRVFLNKYCQFSLRVKLMKCTFNNLNTSILPSNHITVLHCRYSIAIFSSSSSISCNWGEVGEWSPGKFPLCICNHSTNFVKHFNTSGKRLHKFVNADFLQLIVFVSSNEPPYIERSFFANSFSLRSIPLWLTSDSFPYATAASGPPTYP